ncbi:MAG: hypothetical protein WCH31_01960 [Actinomycetes bacterium]
MSDLRRDARAGRWVAVAPGRADRPQEEPDACPFCAGNEHMSTAETFRAGDGPTGWDVRVVPNLYPALVRHEVVAHGPTHCTSFGDLRDATVERVAEAWQRRAADTDGTVFAFLNEGAAAGASRTHSHSQLVWLPGPPPALLAESGPAEVLPFLERGGIVAGCPIASRSPYEVQIAPVDPDPDGLYSELLGDALLLLSETVRCLKRVHGGPVPFNAWLHDGAHWHLEVLPRTTVLAGLELGAGVWINPVPPEVAVVALRAAGAAA